MGWKKLFSRDKNPLSTKSVGFSYSTQEVLRDVSLNLKEGEMIAIIGKSGSGKSTFLKIIAGIISGKTKGKIKIFGKSKLFQKYQIGFVPQEISLIPDLSIEDNIRILGLNLGISEKKALEKANYLLKQLKLDEALTKKPEQLSGGQKVRLNIVVSLLNDPKILILDEPFVGLDFSNRRLLWHFLESMKSKGKSIILTSHLLTETQEHVDRIIILKNGKVFFNGDLEKLKTKLKTNFIFETRISRISKENLEKLKKFCVYKDIQILDEYEKYLMFGLNSENQRKLIENAFDKTKTKYEVIGFREPNLDEVFLRT